MRLIDWLQWACIALISAGCFLISVRVGLIVAGTLGILATTALELTKKG